jgi:hypothetical protein
MVSGKKLIRKDGLGGVMTRPGAKETGATADLDRVVVEVVIVVGFGVPWAARVSLHRPKAVAVRERGGDARPPRENRPAGPGDFRGGPRREGPAGTAGRRPR